MIFSFYKIHEKNSIIKIKT